MHFMYFMPAMPVQHYAKNPVKILGIKTKESSPGTISGPGTARCMMIAKGSMCIKHLLIQRDIAHLQPWCQTIFRKCITQLTFLKQMNFGRKTFESRGLFSYAKVILIPTPQF